MKARMKILVVMVVLGVWGFCFSAELYVPSLYPTIQAGIDDAADGDTVIVADGVYTGEGNHDIDFRGKAITLRSENGPENCTIDCKNEGAGFYLYRDEDRNSVIDGFTIKRGEWGGIYCGMSSPTITNCIITENKGEGGIICYESRAIISNCTINGNRGMNAVTCYRGSPKIINCIISGNKARREEGGAISCYRSDAYINGCTIIGNIGYGISEYKGQPRVTNCIVRSNTNSQVQGNFDVTYSNIEGGWEGEENIDADLRFAFADDFHLMPGSACIDAGDPNYIAEPNETDIEGKERILSGRIDMGAYEYDPNHAVIAISSRELSFQCVEGGPEPGAQSLFIRNCGVGRLIWAITSNCNWLEVEPVEGSSTGEINEVILSARCSGMEAGDYRCMITISDADSANSPVMVQVVLHIGKLLRVPAEYQTIQAAIDAAMDYDVVMVEDGVYTGTGNRDIDFRGKGITVHSENGPENCIIDCENLGAGFYFRNEEDGNSAIDGFTIKNGRWGGIYCEMSSPTITNCIITENKREGGISCYESSAMISNCTIKNNQGRIGGGINCVEGKPEIINCIITDNQSKLGGGIFCSFNSRPKIEGCRITGNYAYEGGGGIYCESFSNPIISNCTISGNQKNGVFFESDNNVNITSCIIEDNEGSGIYCREGRIIINNCRIRRNTGEEGGGGIYCYAYSDVTVADSVVSGNVGGSGGGIYCYYSGLVVTNCTITGNLSDGAGIFTSDSYLKITNCIVWDNLPEQIYSKYGYESIRYNDIQGGWRNDEDGDIWAFGYYHRNEGNIGADPCFVRAGHWDANGTADEPRDDFWVEGDYRLRRQSPCVDAGTDANIYTDIEGKNRPYDFPGIDNNGDEPEFDMGAYELTPVEAQVSFTPKVLNCKSRGKWFKAHIVLPEGISAEDIDVSAPAVIEPFGVESQYVKVAGHNPPQVEVGFGRQAICEAAGQGGKIETAVIGSLTDGRYFVGLDAIVVK